MAPWSSALTEYSRNPDPASLPRGVVVAYDDHTLTIQDAYPKAQYHYLVLPRMPFKVTREEAEEVEQEAKKASDGAKDGNGKATQQPKEKQQGRQQQQLNFASGSMGLARPAPSAQASSSSHHQDSASTSTSNTSTTTPSIIVPPGHLVSLSTLLSSPYRTIILRRLTAAAEQAADRIRSLMPRTHTVERFRAQGSALTDEQTLAGCEWEVLMGFHAVPSMDTVHCHVLSGELVSERLKNKKHYLSFHPTAGFFQPLSSPFFTGPTPIPDKLPHSPEDYEALLRGKLVSHMDGEIYPNMPALKRHLSLAWVADLADRRKGGAGGSGGGSSSSSKTKEGGKGVTASNKSKKGKASAASSRVASHEVDESETEDEDEGGGGDGDGRRPEKRQRVEEQAMAEGGSGKEGEVDSDGSHTEDEA